MRQLALALLLGPAALQGQVRFTPVTRPAGIDFEHRSAPEKKHIMESMSGGVALFDYDNDGRLDIYLTHTQSVKTALDPSSGKSRLYRNLGDGTFRDVTDRAGLGHPGWAMGVSAADFDGDGRLDLYVTCFGPNRLYRNNGDGTFREVAEPAGVADSRWSAGSAFGDFDRDGDLDLFVANYVDLGLEDLAGFGEEGQCLYRGVSIQCDPRHYRGASDALFENLGDGTFRDVSQQAGVEDPDGYYGMAATWLDVDRDGLLDLYVANDSRPSFLYRNLGGRFEEVGFLSGTALPEDGREQGSMGVAVGDYDRDGRVDLYVTNFAYEYNVLHRQEQPLYFSDASFSSRTAESSLPLVGWGTEFVDIDNDGWLDLVAANGHLYPEVETLPGVAQRVSAYSAAGPATYAQPLLLYANNRDGTFSPAAAGPALEERRVGRGLAAGDWDNDGDLDLVVNNLDGRPTLLRNDGGNRNSWIRIRLEGPPPNRFGVGSLVRVVAGGERQTSTVRSGGSYLSQSDLRPHFGLGSHDWADLVEVVWPDGRTTRLTGVAARREVVISGQREPELQPTRSGSNQAMAQALELIAERVDDSGANPFAPRARIERARRSDPPRELGNRLVFKLRLARWLLEDGQTAEAIRELESVMGEVEANAERLDPETIENIRPTLATAYLRLGEQQNCIFRHGSDSCLFPVRGRGVHRLQQGSRRAVEELLRVLARDPGDLNSIWLLNVAAMTLGDYPDGVPQRWRIPESALASDYDIGRFRDVAPHLGLDVLGLSGGSIVEDFDGDGYLDIAASSWGLRDQLRLFRNNGDGTFSERTREAGLEGIVGGLNLNHADYNNDGHADIYVMRGAWLARLGRHPNSLLRNNGDGTFTDVTREAGLFDLAPGQTAAWGDYDNDGWLDLFVGTESWKEDRYPCRLYRNNGDGTFTDVARALGVEAGGFVKGGAWGDYDNDGLIDLYVSRLLEPNLLFRNRGKGANGDWNPFLEVAGRAGVTEPLHAFPTWFFDYDNDGWLDLFVSGYEVDYINANARAVAAEYLGLPTQAEKPKLYRNRGDGTFADVTREAGIDRVFYTMGCNYGDLDNDGWPDFYLGTGAPDFRALVPNLMFRNDRGRAFQDVTTSGGFGHLQKGHGVSFADLDNDGDQDIYAVMGGAYAGDVYQNVLFLNPGHDNRWITLRLEGATSNRAAVGARIRLIVESESGPREIHTLVSTGASFGSNSLQQEIGLGRAGRIRLLEIRWPGSPEPQVIEGIGMDRIWKIRQGEEPVEVPARTLSLGQKGS